MRRLALLLVLAACGKPADKAPPAPPPVAAPAPEPKHEDRHDPATAAPALKLDVVIGGKTTTWTRDVFDKVPHVAGSNNDGEAREVWSLRELAHQVGPTARVIAVTGADGKKAIDPAAWADASRIPILHTTRRGTLKFRWTDAAGKWGETELKDVVALEIVP